MSEPNETTFATRFLDHHPEVRTAVSNSEDFVTWRDKFPSVIVDGVKYYVRGGDMLQEEDELIFEWARQSGLITEDSINREREAEKK